MMSTWFAAAANQAPDITLRQFSGRSQKKHLKAFRQIFINLPVIHIRKTVAADYHEAVSLFKKSPFLQEALGEHISKHLIESKDREWDESPP